MFKLRHTALAALAIAATGLGLVGMVPEAEAQSAKAVRGVVTNIDGDLVTMRQPWGEDIVVVFDRKHRQRPFRAEVEEGMDLAVILDPRYQEPTAKILCAAIVPAPPYVAVQPLQIPAVSAPPPRPVVAPPPAPQPPPPQILFY
ncbi:hypothetical protein L3556_08010 [Candidatus Synechococcus calcipolaris G9]|uniref:Uncharacterized protein n=1 Tax=Candidatus Synechococcus calcipolaris G9 TaxID=1497997 RepID=A0ABT6EYH7_9SYNE|nr:hypothetical protein [Candidatus Synechococcus calcipolaris]MDG2990870.1 hypothetical protein [Candidatus Synechococcus calcipolaris G9]